MLEKALFNFMRELKKSIIIVTIYKSLSWNTINNTRVMNSFSTKIGTYLQWSIISWLHSRQKQTVPSRKNHKNNYDIQWQLQCYQIFLLEFQKTPKLSKTFQIKNLLFLFNFKILEWIQNSKIIRQTTFFVYFLNLTNFWAADAISTCLECR